MCLLYHDLLLMVRGDGHLGNRQTPGLSTTVFVRGLPSSDYEIVDFREYLDISSIVHHYYVIVVVRVVFMDRCLLMVASGICCLLNQLLTVLLSIAILLGVMAMSRTAAS